jgi:hypothetical protein
VNKTLPAGAQIRVFAGDPPAGSGLGRGATAFSVLQEHVLKTHRKGAGDLWIGTPSSRGF